MAITVDRKKVAWRDQEGQLMVLNLETGESCSFNETGRALWLAVQETGSTDSAVERVLAEYDASQERVEADAERLVADMLKGGFFELEE